MTDEGGAVFEFGHRGEPAFAHDRGERLRGGCVFVRAREAADGEADFGGGSAGLVDDERALVGRVGLAEGRGDRAVALDPAAERLAQGSHHALRVEAADDDEGRVVGVQEALAHEQKVCALDAPDRVGRACDETAIRICSEEACGDGAVCRLGGRGRGLAQRLDARRADALEGFGRELRVHHGVARKLQKPVEVRRLPGERDVDGVVAGRDLDAPAEFVADVVARLLVEHRVGQRRHQSLLVSEVEGRAAVYAELDEHALVAGPTEHEDAQAVEQLLALRLGRGLTRSGN